MRVLFMTLGLLCLAGCSPPEPAAAPRQSAAESAAEHDDQSEHDQLALARRRLQLEKQVLTELRKLRDSRQASMGAAEPARDDEPVSTADYDLLVFGGPIHDAFVGCLCDESRRDSVFNKLGEHGSDLSPTSMRNKFSPYGSNYDDTSACNAAATHPPLVVTSDGKSLGLLTVNPALKRRITTPTVADWLTRMCGE